ncbi:glutamate racemase [Acidocella sp.]|uniref:glutamate racemase n=1 Tax=Acidocella sp. TaxID=50710 RepID=UPI00260EAA56|nr:glutamate racemase [Acidocella sp.]
MALLVFDSGIGGLGVVRQLRGLAPELPLIYLADSGFFPYGEKPDELLLAHILALLEAAVARFTPEAVLVACNTASTIALPALRAAHQTLPFIGCVPPVKPAAAASRTRTIGVLATAATVRRPYLGRLVAQFAPGFAVHSLGTSALAALAERKFRGEAVDVASAIAPLFAQPGAEAIDAIALGCTHYTFLLPEFTALHPEISWFDPALPVARQSLKITADITLNASPAAGTAFFTGPQPPVTLLVPYGFTGAAAFGP